MLSIGCRSTAVDSPLVVRGRVAVATETPSVVPTPGSFGHLQQRTVNRIFLISCIHGRGRSTTAGQGVGNCFFSMLTVNGRSGDRHSDRLLRKTSRIAVRLGHEEGNTAFLVTYCRSSGTEPVCFLGKLLKPLATLTVRSAIIAWIRQSSRRCPVQGSCALTESITQFAIAAASCFRS